MLAEWLSGVRVSKEEGATGLLGVKSPHDLEPLKFTVFLYFQVPLVLTARVSGRKNPTAHPLQRSLQVTLGL